MSNEMVCGKRGKQRKPNTWGSIYRKAIARGDDHGYAAYLANQWEQRQKRKRNGQPAPQD